MYSIVLVLVLVLVLGNFFVFPRLKAANMKAQGNALGKDEFPSLGSPVRAIQYALSRPYRALFCGEFVFSQGVALGFHVRGLQPREDEEIAEYEYEYD